MTYLPTYFRLFYMLSISAQFLGIMSCLCRFFLFSFNSETLSPPRNKVSFLSFFSRSLFFFVLPCWCQLESDIFRFFSLCPHGNFILPAAACCIWLCFCSLPSPLHHSISPSSTHHTQIELRDRFFSLFSFYQILLPCTLRERKAVQQLPACGRIEQKKSCGTRDG